MIIRLTQPSSYAWLEAWAELGNKKEGDKKEEDKKETAKIGDENKAVTEAKPAEAA